MFQCEHPDTEYDYIKETDEHEPLRLKILQDPRWFGDAPEFLQLNWNNTVLWRRHIVYPK